MAWSGRGRPAHGAPLHAPPLAFLPHAADPTPRNRHAVASQQAAHGDGQRKQQQPRAAGAAAAASLVDADGTDLSEFVLPSDSPVGAKRAACSSSDDDDDSDAGADGTKSRGAGRGGGHPTAAPLPPARKPQVIFCSRTHSQLSQFVGELRRTRFAQSLSLVAVASRRALCVNEQVG